MKILALDIGTAIGWAFGEADDVPDCGTIVLPSFANGWGAQMASYCDWLADFIHQHQPREIVRESVPGFDFKSPAAAQVLIGLAGATELICYRRDRRCIEAHVGAVRKVVCGNGNAKKEAVNVEVIRRGCSPDGLNASDAAAVWFWRVEMLRKARAAA